MEREQIREELKNIISRVLKHSDFVLNDETQAGDIAGWDSLSHMVIITEIEKHFNIRISFIEAANMENVGDMISLLMKKC